MPKCGTSTVFSTPSLPYNLLTGKRHRFSFVYTKYWSNIDPTDTFMGSCRILSIFLLVIQECSEWGLFIIRGQISFDFMMQFRITCTSDFATTTMIGIHIIHPPPYSFSPGIRVPHLVVCCVGAAPPSLVIFTTDSSSEKGLIGLASWHILFSYPSFPVANLVPHAIAR
jgi:hypothetical protein